MSEDFTRDQVYDVLTENLLGDGDLLQFALTEFPQENASEAEGDALDWLTDLVTDSISSLSEAVPEARRIIDRADAAMAAEFAEDMAEQAAFDAMSPVEQCVKLADDRVQVRRMLQRLGRGQPEDDGLTLTERERALIALLIEQNNRLARS